jgi:hypothetical protein
MRRELMVSTSVRLLCRGEGTEILYQLMGYGVPIDLLPVTETGNVKTKYLSMWCKVRKSIEDKNKSKSNSSTNKCNNNSGVASDENGGNVSAEQTSIECPGLNDVVRSCFTGMDNEKERPAISFVLLVPFLPFYIRFFVRVCAT